MKSGFFALHFQQLMLSARAVRNFGCYSSDREPVVLIDMPAGGCGSDLGNPSAAAAMSVSLET